MFNLPYTEIRKIKTSKINRVNDRTLLGDKILSRSREPTAYNLQVGLAVLDAKVNSKTPNERTLQVNFDRQQIAEEMLALMNVSVEDVSRDFSLLEFNSDKEEEQNSNIIDEKDFNNTVNKDITAVDKFKDDSDPIYQLDDENSDTAKDKIKKADPSYVAATFTVLNQNPKYFGKNKYFKGEQ
tara:strand:+ start:159 stop:707 length:549 start_codon:yes stop_codon:yes gene_type:complete